MMNPKASSSISLHDAPVRLRGHVTEVRTDPETAGLLEGLGICEGRELRLLRRGKAYVVSVYGTRIGLAASVATAIFVTPQ